MSKIDEFITEFLSNEPSSMEFDDWNALAKATAENVKQLRTDLSDSTAQLALDDDVITQLRAELAAAQNALVLIADIAIDRDGYTGNADKLGKLIDEIYGYAKNPEMAEQKFTPYQSDQKIPGAV